MASIKPIPGAVALLCLAAFGAQAQDRTLRPVTITGTGTPAAADVTGFGDFPRRDVPISTTVIDRRQIEGVGAERLADLTQFDSSLSDAYNAPGYWDFIAIRGFVLDNRFNFRREGLPISAETTIPLDNKERVELLKGTSGIQAGTSAPGGLVNYVVKRPTATDLRAARLQVQDHGSLLGAVDLGGRFGRDGMFGYRVNVAAERLRPYVRNLDGDRGLFAFAGDWRVSRDSLLEGEFEWSRQTQASQTGFSLLGATLPAPVDPRLNLNNQPWTQPSEFNALTGTLRFTQALARDWRWSAQLGTQRLRSDDFTAFPFGCGAEGNFDRFCSDGTFDYYDFRSEDERRRQHAAALNLQGRVQTGGISHDLSAGLMVGRVRSLFNLQAFNFVGTGTVDGSSVVPPDPTRAFFVPDRDERSTELSLQDAVRFNERLTAWLGVRHTHLNRGYSQDLTTPWAAVSYKLRPELLAYASWGQGMESQQVSTSPTLALANAGTVLPATKSSQWELGLRGGDAAFNWNATLFRIKRPLTNFDFCIRTFSCAIGEYDGQAVHQGLELGAGWARGPWELGGSVTALDAKREGSIYEPATNGQRPVNVPDFVLRASAGYKLAAVPGLALRGHVSHEGRRAVLPDNSVMLPSWTRVDAALQYSRRLGAVQTSWSLGVDNVFDRRYWKESPTQFGHIYLYPGAPRSFRLTFTAQL
ncbi:MAG TPA: TonB-dependent siderophore receptor [Ramlibacter sp.]|nr:TonB-dependent siderophore receptor [Ramlibacter sp.]